MAIHNLEFLLSLCVMIYSLTMFDYLNIKLVLSILRWVYKLFPQLLRSRCGEREEAVRTTQSSPL